MIWIFQTRTKSLKRSYDGGCRLNGFQAKAVKKKKICTAIISQSKPCVVPELIAHSNVTYLRKAFQLPVLLAIKNKQALEDSVFPKLSHSQKIK